MAIQRYLAIVHLKTKWSRMTEASRYQAHVKSCYPNAEAFHSTEQGCIHCVTDSASATDVWKKLSRGLVRGDTLSVVEMGRDICTTEKGVQSWLHRTQWQMSAEPA